MLKMNVDGVVFEDINGFGEGIVVRDEKGLLLAGRTRLHHGRVQPEVVEALGIKEG